MFCHVIIFDLILLTYIHEIFYTQIQTNLLYIELINVKSVGKTLTSPKIDYWVKRGSHEQLLFLLDLGLTTIMKNLITFQR